MRTIWVIGFCGQARIEWWRRFITRPGFTHCFCMRYDVKSKAWLYAEWSSRTVIYEIISRETADKMLRLCAMTGGDAVRIEVERDESAYQVFAMIPVLYCTTAIQRLAGLRGWFISPHSLYCALLRRGGQSILRQDHSEQAGG